MGSPGLDVSRTISSLLASFSFLGGGAAAFFALCTVTSTLRTALLVHSILQPGAQYDALVVVVLPRLPVVDCTFAIVRATRKDAAIVAAVATNARKQGAHLNAGCTRWLPSSVRSSSSPDPTGISHSLS